MRFLVKFNVILLFSVLFLVAGMGCRPVAAADGENQISLTLEEAVQRALEQNYGLKSAAYDVERAYEVRKFAADKVKFVPLGPTTSEAERAFTGLVQADLNWQMAKRSYEAQRDSVVMSVYQAYAAVLQYRARLETAEAQYTTADLQYRFTNLAYATGTASRIDSAKAFEQREASYRSLESVKEQLADAYQKLNQLIGLEADEQPVLITEVEVRPLEVLNLEAEVHRVKGECPSVWLAEKKIDLAQIARELYNFADPYRSEPYEAKIIDISKSEISAADVKEQMAKLTRSLYYATRQVEASYDAALHNLLKSREDLRLAEVKYAAGTATRLELAKARAEVVQAEQTVKELAWQHEVMVLAFEKPWAYAGAASR